MVTRRKTRKAVTATVEGLHASFHRLDQKVHAMITKGCTDRQLTSCIRKEWSGLFHTDLSTPAVRGLVMHYRALHKGARKTRKQKQKGGMAPMNWTLGQGTTDPVYGRFPVEIGTSPQAIRGLDLGRFFESNTGRTCNTTGGHPAPNQSQSQGGGSFTAAMAQGHFPATIPHNTIQTIGSSLQGAPIVNPPADPVSATTHLSNYTLQPYDARALMQIDTMAPIYRS